ncbi:MAG: S1 RNA-binding domain-containing protein [Chloroflexota bacterium]
MMSNDAPNSGGVSAQPPLDESYWDSLLTEDEYINAPSEDESILSSEPAPTFDTPPSNLNQMPPPNELETDWTTVADIMDNDGVLDLKVVGYNRGGLLVEWRSLRGFVPASQLVRFPISRSENERREALIERVGDALHLRVIELDREKNRLILSERAAQVEAGTRDRILTRLSAGDVVSGKVTNLCDFGAFIDLGGVEGLIHISELSWGRVGHPADMLSRNDIVEAYVIEVDPDDARIALSLKRLTPDPWATVDERYEVGEVVEGTITNVVDFGAFACIEEGLEGLIHFSELAEGHFLHPRNVVQEGEQVQARILSIDGKARRLGLSLRLL